jgi:hypothetical protein
LRYYDSTRFTEYCCDEHANLFNGGDVLTAPNVKKPTDVMVPSMSEKIENLISNDFPLK